MARILDKIKRWFGRQERNTLQYEQRHEEFDQMTDRVMDHKEHMFDRLEEE